MENKWEMFSYDLKIINEINIQKILLSLKNIENLIKNGYNVIKVFINSYGGSIDGCQFFFNAIQELRTKYGIHFVCYANNALSSAYWIACAFDKIMAIDENSTFGNVGVINLLNEESDANIFYVSSSDLKSELAGLKLISEDTKKQLQENNTKIYNTFIKAILKKRNIKKDLLQGQIFLASQALQHGFIDGVLTMDEDLKNLELRNNNVDVEKLRLELERIKNEFQAKQENFQKQLENEIKRIEEIYLIGVQLDLDKDEIKEAISNSKLSSGEFAISQIKKMGRTSISLKNDSVNVNSIIDKIMNK